MNEILNLIENSDAVLIGAGSGLSTSAGFIYSGPRFIKYFSDFERKYGFHDMYSGGFADFESPEEFWGFWSRYIYINRYMDPPKTVYSDLLKLVQGKEYFVLTTNVDHCFQKAGFEKERLFYTQGDYGLWQCSVPCHKKTYDNEDAVMEMVKNQSGLKIPSKLLPVCPVCGKPMTMNLRADDTFVEEEDWHKAADRYEEFLNKWKDSNILYLELGVGGNTPGIIKYPFWNLTYNNPKAKYVCINKGEAVCPAEIKKQSICVNGDIGEVISEMLKEKD